ncbi:hypothetical protein V6N13_007788 [Hibiscus sabdariffa]|uniref:Zinc knuckle CX2CX4HX4C domain-containing protein n=1 Tax=Hibiscus sabdariffa TaxID=183260 RepID=A0ABR2EMP1_9ROSI
MVNYLRVGIVLGVTKPVRRCVTIGGTGPSPKLCPKQYEHLPTLYHGCGIIGHNLDDCTTFKQTPTSELQYGDWLRYIPPQKQELNTHPKGSIRYFDGTRSAYPKQPSNGQKLNINRPVKGGSTSNIVTNVDPTNAPTTPVEGNTNVKLVTTPAKQIVATIAPHGASHAKDSKLAAATSPLTPTIHYQHYCSIHET